MNRVVCLVSCLVLGFAFSIPASAETRAEQIAEAKRLLEALPPMPPKDRDLGIPSYYYGQLERLRESIEKTANADTDNKTHESRFLNQRTPYSTVVKAKAALYHTLVADLASLGPEAKEYCLPTYIDAHKMRPLPPLHLLRLNLADSLGSTWLPRSNVSNLDHILNKATYFSYGDWFEFKQKITDQGLLQMSEGSLRLGDLIEKMPGQMEKEIAAHEQALAELTQRAVRADASQFNTLNQEREDLKSDGSRLFWKADYALRQFGNVLPLLDQIKKATGPELDVIATQMEELGKGFRSASTTADELFAHVRAGNRGRLPEHYEGMRLNDPVHDIYDLLGTSEWGGHIISQYTRSPEDAAEYLAYYHQMNLLKYVLVAGAAISRITETKEGKASVGQRIATEWKFGMARLTGKAPKPAAQPTVLPPVDSSTLIVPQAGALSASHAEPASKAPPRRDQFLPDELRARRNALEDQLWRKFFKAAGLTPEEGSTGGCSPQTFAALSHFAERLTGPR